MIKYTFIPFILVLFFFSCEKKSSKSNISTKKEHKQIKNKVKSTTNPPEIDIQPFFGMNINELNYVHTELRNFFPTVVLKEAIPLPSSAYYKARNRFRADSLISFLRLRTPNKRVTIGITHKDISASKGEYADWGVMGLGFCPGNACVVSTFRLSKNAIQRQLFKVAIHELGHTQGLQHCEAKTCFMRDAEGENHTDEETDFCPRCKSYLVKEGWIFK